VLTAQFPSVKEVANLLPVGGSAVRAWIKGADLRGINVGREWRIAAEDLESYLDRLANRPRDHDMHATPADETGSGSDKIDRP
jgi:excisionase family DNA binding protein